ncbi:Holliday junction branch migration protein RuvA [Holospora undulata]|uniref:Holliday junction branch migration complex subunit RuvA n=3 Tax=Holospora TaxID=44747 RepID=A0A061JI58_9PROT|nr:Holliday junction branch migration protein RuvA [Holospora undulata]ETZ04689.1 Holliday junction ATP-dependent DNA helicase RuvA [Holospora undulata HU1]GAJ46231.1 Holliday junction ATP-dependent DNA helicase RuvA [Holospora elegans E1]
MIGYLSGRIIRRKSPIIILEIQGIGYVVYVNHRQLERWGDTVSLWIETVMKEHQSELYGFESLKEQSAFLQLQKVPGLGPKVALSILSFFDDVSQLYGAIQQQDFSRFKMIPGIGAKLASRIIQELQQTVMQEDSVRVQCDEEVKTALQALCALGYESRIALNVLQQITKEEKDVDAEAYVRHALKRLPS